MHSHCCIIINKCEQAHTSIADLYRLDREQTSERMELSEKMSTQLKEITANISDIRANQTAMDGNDILEKKNVTAGKITATQADKDKIADIEKQKETLRTELAEYSN